MVSELYSIQYNDDYLAHHGIKGQTWGKRNGPPYPLDDKLSRKIQNKADKYDKYSKKEHEINESKHSKYYKISVTNNINSAQLYYKKKIDKYIKKIEKDDQKYAQFLRKKYKNILDRIFAGELNYNDVRKIMKGDFDNLSSIGKKYLDQQMTKELAKLKVKDLIIKRNQQAQFQQQIQLQIQQQIVQQQIQMQIQQDIQNNIMLQQINQQMFM